MAIESERDRTLKPKHKYKSCLSGCLYLIQRDIFINKMYNFFVLLREQRYWKMGYSLDNEKSITEAHKDTNS